MSTSSTQPEQAGFQKALKNRHLQMIALGGAIGTGLFYGSADSISIAGPAVLLAYIIGGAAIFLVVRALGEMSVDQPSSGAFSHYAYQNWSPRAGFVSGWNYWFNYVAVAMVELSVVGIFLNFWFPSVPRWITAAVVLVTITAVNLLGVKFFGETEFWLALIKVVAVIGMIVLGLVTVIRGVPVEGMPNPSFANLINDGGIFPLGVSGLIAAFAVVMFSFGGTELIGIAAGEAENPKKSIPKAINQVIYRILIFYVGALTVVMAVIPWRKINDESSPFVQIFSGIGIPGAAHILNMVVLTAVVSVYNSALYSNGRMLHSLAVQGNAPAYMRKLSKRGVPTAAVLTSSAVTIPAVVVVFLWKDFAFTYLLSIAMAAAVINWSMICITQLKFRRRIGPQAAAKLEFKMPGYPVTTWIALGFLAMLVVVMACLEANRIAIYVGPGWLIALLIGYEVNRRLRERAH